MTIYDAIYVNGSEVKDYYNLKVDKKVGQDNSSSKFNCTVDNYNGKNNDLFNVGNEVEIYADKDINPPTTKIFTGILENISYPSDPNDEKLRIGGRDFSARLIDRNILPEVYTGLPAGSIVLDIIDKYTDDVTTNNVNLSTIDVDRIAFNQKPVFDGIKRLAEIADYDFYVDEDKDLHFKQKSTEDSGHTFNNANVTRANVKQRRDNLYNEVWVYGERYMDSFQQEFNADGAGSVFNLLYKPHNSKVNVGSPVSTSNTQKGGIFGMNQVPPSGTDYLIDFHDKQIVFVSGTDLGYSSIPSSGDLITVEYDRELPIIKTGRNSSSINQYGKRIKVINDDDIKDPDTAQQVVEAELAASSVPEVDGNLSIHGLINVTPGQTCNVNLPHQGIKNETYDIISAKYNFSKDNNLSEDVLNVKINKRLEDSSDIIKNLVNDVKALQSANMDNPEILSRFEFTTGSLSVQQSDVKVYQRSATGSVMIWDNPIYATWGTDKWGTEGSAFTDYTLVYSGTN